MDINGIKRGLGVATYGLVLAGGRGSRLPIAGDIPKQFCPMDGEKTFIQGTCQNLIDIGLKPANIVVIVTNKSQRNHAERQLVDMGIIKSNIILISPHWGYVGCMVYGANYIREIAGKNVTIINTPSDQYISGTEKYQKAIGDACYNAYNGKPTMIGVKISDNNIVGGCGNAKYDTSADGPCYPVLSFIEKPGKLRRGESKKDAEKRVAKILNADDTAVNTGINVWTADQILEALPFEMVEEMHEKLLERQPKISDVVDIDTDKMVEALKGIELVIGRFEWKDCGTLAAYYSIQKTTPNHRNASIGNVYRSNCRDSLFVSNNEGMAIYATNIQGCAIIVNVSGNDINVACINLAYSQDAGSITDYFESGQRENFSLKSNANMLVPSNISETVRAAFLGVQNVYIIVNRLADGNINVIVSANGECQY